jgi:nitronate monooxygenase
VKGKNFWVSPRDLDRAREWAREGHTKACARPTDTVVFVTPAERDMIQQGPEGLHGLPVALRFFVMEGP